MARIVPTQVDGARGYDVLSPVTGEPIGQYAVASAQEVQQAVARAREVQPAWAAVPVQQRARMMDKALALMVQRQQTYLDRLTAETGRPEIETLMIELFATCDAMNFYGRRAASVLADRRVGMHLLKMKSAKVVYRPMGVVGVISPWNGPLVLSINPTIQAVLAGNAVVLKPSEYTPEAGRITQEIFRDAGFPKDLVQVVLGDGETGAALVRAGVDKLTFTGSVATGRKIGAAAGEQLIPCTLELGGKDPMIVLDDADLDRAAGGAVFGAIMNTGQFCSGVERVYVVREVADTFIDKVVERVSQLQLGRDYGPFIFEGQADIVQRQVDAAIAAGARCMCGGERNDNTFTPTVLVDVDHGMALMTEETFGPVIPIVVVDDETTAIQMANDCAYGLSASVWTKDKARGERVARQLESGSATINETSMIYGALELPFGGQKHSGLGRVNGADGLLNYAAAFPILTDRFGAREEAVWHPYTEEKTSKIAKALKVLWGSPLRRLL